MIGQTLDHYRIESKLGEGGMGVVYKARDTHLDRPVAIKVLPADKVTDPARKKRFVQEAKAASALNHPHIVTIYDIRSPLHDFDTQGGVDFLVLEYIQGLTLDQKLGASALTEKELTRLGTQLAQGLAGCPCARSGASRSETRQPEDVRVAVPAGQPPHSRKRRRSCDCAF
jgi:eukaryotic-like serine/threonine-protein kinase